MPANTPAYSIVYTTRLGWARVEKQVQDGITYYAVFHRESATSLAFFHERTFTGEHEKARAIRWANYMANE